MPVSAPADHSVPEPQSARTQTERILLNGIFRDSPIQQRLLRYLVDQTLAGAASGLKEYSIGSAVFGRRDDFDPRTDSIVRVQAGVLRKKLAAYYAGPGTQDEWIVDLPRGHYVPSFTPRKTEPVPSAPAGFPMPDTPGVPRRPIWAYVAAAAAAGALAGALAVFAAVRMEPLARPSPVAAHALEWASHPLWKGFFEPGSTVKLVIGAPMLVNVDGLLLRDVDVNSPEDIAGSAAVRRLEQETHAKSNPVEVYTGMGEAEGASLLTRFFTRAAIDLPLIRNNLTRWQDLSAGNLIFLASLRFRTLGRELDRPSDFQFVTAPGQPSLLKNLRPRPGEESVYHFSTTKLTRASGTDYALVTVWPSTFPGRRVMFIGGSSTWGTAAAAAYITDSLSLRELWDRIGQAAPAGKTGLQILLKVGIKDNQAASTTFVTSHWLP